MFGGMFAGVPVEFTNSVVAHATFHRCRTQDYPVQRRASLRLRRPGRCRRLDGRSDRGRCPRSRSSSATWCSTPTGRAAAAVIMAASKPIRRFRPWPSFSASTEAELLQLGSEWVSTIPLSSRMRQELRQRLFRLGLAIGNTLNVKPCHGVADQRLAVASL